MRIASNFWMVLQKLFFCSLLCVGFEAHADKLKIVYFNVDTAWMAEANNYPSKMNNRIEEIIEKLRVILTESNNSDDVPTILALSEIRQLKKEVFDIDIRRRIINLVNDEFQDNLK